jgi:hypothetical protein
MSRNELKSIKTFVTLSSSTLLSTANNEHVNANPSNQFSFNSTYELEVYNAIHQIKSNAIGMAGVPFQFLKNIMPHIIHTIIQIFNIILMTSEIRIS